MLTDEKTLLDVFIRIANDSILKEREVIRCGGEGWTYSEIDTVSSATAIFIARKYGSRPTVAVISENHPYTLVLMLAVWKLGGIIACLDCHAPEELMKGMLGIVAPTTVFIQSTDTANQMLLRDLELPIEVIVSQRVTIANLSQQCLHLSADLPEECAFRPGPDDTSHLIFTSSATSLANLKCVPINHGVLFHNGRGQLLSIPRHAPALTLDGVRVLGWSPFSHIMSICLDFGTYTLLTAGCYIFGITPQSYFESGDLSQSNVPYDIPSLLLRTAEEEKPEIFASVPWVIDGFRRVYQQQSTNEQYHIASTLHNFKAIVMGGAAVNDDTARWIQSLSLPAFPSLGMTELGGNLYYGKVLRPTDICIPNAEVTVADEEGNTDVEEGELVITSPFIPKGYLNYESSAFSLDLGGRITFRTGDIYARVDGGWLWKGRRDDYVQLMSGESLDPRPIEAALNDCETVANSCIVGDQFLSGPSRHVCAIVQLAKAGLGKPKTARAEVTRLLGKINRGLAPPLRILWAHVLFLAEGQDIPMTRKRTVFRKMLQEVFGVQLTELLTTTNMTSSDQKSTSKQPLFSEAFVRQTIIDVVSNTLKVHPTDIENDHLTPFADYGLDSASATEVINALNNRLSIAVPMNTCHNYVNLASLTLFILRKTGHLPDESSSLPHKVVPEASHPLEPIAIVGQAVRLPGDINTVESLWEALMTQRNDILTETPSDRWDDSSFLDSDACRITFRKSGFVNVSSFDNSFFGISSPEALYIMPSGTDTGIYVASGLDTGYSELLYLDKGWRAFNRFYGTGVAVSTACGRLSYLLDLHGPSVTIETACSGGMVALDSAVRHLQSGRGEAAIVCSANTHTMPGMFGFLSAQGMTSPQSRCATFTNGADGYATSEGAVALVLKTLSSALRDGDNIQGIIRSTNTMHSGRTQGLVAPSSESQATLQRSILLLSSLSPSDIDFMEAHGTGTSLGDSIEIEGINEVFKGSHTEDCPLVIGAGKACVGHTEATSGLVGIVKALLSLQHGQVPGINHLTASNLNPSLDCSAVPLHIPYRNISLQRNSERPWRALVMAYGFAGTISGAVVQEPTRRTTISEVAGSVSTVCSTPMLFVVSAKCQPALLAYIDGYIAYCQNAAEDRFQSICYTSCVGREHYRHRFACVATGMHELIKALKARKAQGPQVPAASSPELIMAFPGQGTQHFAMARDLAERFPAFKVILAEQAARAYEISGIPALALLLGDETDVDLNSGSVSQLCIFVYQCSLSQWLRSLDLPINGLLGHSFGEIAAAVVGGFLEYSLAIQFVYNRAVALQCDPTNPGAMVAVSATEDVVRACIESFDTATQNSVVIAVYNAADAHTISGTLDAVTRIADRLKQGGYRTMKLNVEQGAPCIEIGLKSFSRWLGNTANRLSQRALEIPMYSTVRVAKLEPGTILSTDYWLDHARQPVKFCQTVDLLTQRSSGVILDIGPQPTLWSILQRGNPSNPNRRWIYLATTAKPGRDQGHAFLLAVAKLFENNVPISLLELYKGMSQPFGKTSIPTYPFQRQHHYPTYIPSSNHGPSDQPPSESARTTLLESDAEILSLLKEHRIQGRCVLPGAAFAALLCQAEFNKVHYVAHVRFHRPFVVESISSRVDLERRSDGEFIIYSGGAKNDEQLLCSGHLGSPPFKRASPFTVHQTSPLRTLATDEIYGAFRENINFGPAFQNIRKITIWEDHVDGLIRVSSPSTLRQDHIRKLDPCLHMFGALLPHLGKQFSSEIIENGFFLPTSLEEFALHSDDLPAEFIYRYYLPIERSGERHPIVSVRFEALSLNGDLLVTCAKYTVAWLPKGIAIRTSSPTFHAHEISWLRREWRSSALLDIPARLNTVDDNRSLVYVGDIIHAERVRTFLRTAQDAFFIPISSPCEQYFQLRRDTLSMDTAVPCNRAMVQGRTVHIVVDIIDDCPEACFAAAWRQVLILMKHALSGQFRLSDMIVACSGVQTMPPGVAIVVEGMLAVFRREMGLRPEDAWILRLPKDADIKATCGLIRQELLMRVNRVERNSTVWYFKGEKGLERQTSVLSAATESQQLRLSNVAVVVGMGSIGMALGPALLAAGCSKVVYLGRKSRDTDSVIKGVTHLQSISSDAFRYMQTDILDLAILQDTFKSVISECGPIKTIIHTAGVVKDAPINVVSESDFELVLKPKVEGAWNLHMVDRRMNLQLEAFVLTSSISVSLGNPGQIAYVAANSYLDALAVHRQAIGLPGLSLQLGAWESPLIEGLDSIDALVQPILHEEGIPFIIKAMGNSSAVQVIAKLDKEKLSNLPLYKEDPLFEEILRDRPGQSAVALSVEETRKAILQTLKDAMEMGEDDLLDCGESLTSLGFDSISFAQARGELLNKFGIEIPLKYLSDVYTVEEIITEAVGKRSHE